MELAILNPKSKNVGAGMVPNDKTYLFIMLEGKFKVVNPKSGLKIYEFSPHKLFSAITLLVPHSVEFPGFSCQLDFS